MKAARDFLTALAQAVSALSLYGDGHPARERAIDRVHEKLQLLQEDEPVRRFTFLPDEIVLDGRPLVELKRWDWGGRLARGGIQRVECLGPVERADLEAFLDDVWRRVGGAPLDTAEVRQGHTSNIRYGSVTLQREEEADPVGDPKATATLGFDLADEVATVEWLHTELKDRKALDLLEAESIVRSLSIAMHGDQAFLLPLLQLKRYDQYTTTHALNVAVLAMALAESLGLSPREIRSFGTAGLLHDIGKVTIPEEVLNKPGKLSEKERQLMNRHPAEGARIILEGEERLEMAAVVAYEHHICLNGSGYPHLVYERPCHRASDLVHVCDVFDALRTRRPYRDAWEESRVLDYIEQGSGTEFEPDLAKAFVAMMRTWSDRVATVSHPEDRTSDEAGGGA
jgi:putative nucleotidyltransferase with HDIG domain